MSFTHHSSSTAPAVVEARSGADGAGLHRLRASGVITTMQIPITLSETKQPTPVMTTTTKDLTKEAATSPRQRTGGYVILARLTDKARADIAGQIGEYHTDCPLDHYLLDWK